VKKQNIFQKTELILQFTEIRWAKISQALYSVGGVEGKIELKALKQAGLTSTILAT